MPDGQGALLAGFGLVFAFAFITLAEGAKRVPAAETALLGLLETPLAPVWAWLAFAEVPGTATLVGGAVILASVVAHTAWTCERAASTRRGAEPAMPDAERPPPPARRRRA